MAQFEQLEYHQLLSRLQYDLLGSARSFPGDRFELFKQLTYNHLILVHHHE
jgi:hypothetical protein